MMSPSSAAREWATLFKPGLDFFVLSTGRNSSSKQKNRGDLGVNYGQGEAGVYCEHMREIFHCCRKIGPGRGSRALNDKIKVKSFTVSPFNYLRMFSVQASLDLIIIF